MIGLCPTAKLKALLPELFTSDGLSTFTRRARLFYPIINEESLKLARFFAEEERLAALISEPKTVDKDTIYAVVVTARKIAAKGYSTNLVPLDEMLDLAQIYISATDPEVAANLLVELLSNIKETGNTAWTARVAAVLAYFSNLQGQALQD